MPSEASPEPDPATIVIHVGEDRAGHWLVQDSAKRMEGRFVSRTSAMIYAEAERQIYHAEVAMAATPLVALVSVRPVAAHERGLSRAA